MSYLQMAELWPWLQLSWEEEVALELERMDELQAEPQPDRERQTS